MLQLCLVKLLISLDPEIRKMQLTGLYKNENSTLDSGLWLSWHWKLNQISKIENCIEFNVRWQVNDGPRMVLELIIIVNIRKFHNMYQKAHSIRLPLSKIL